MKIKTVQNCARCGSDHVDVDARRMARPFAPPEAGGIVWTHWFPCPTNGDPVLVFVVDAKGPVVEPLPLHGLSRTSS